MTGVRSLSRSIDYLGEIGAKLRDLQGYATLIHELIQNADDALASRMSFDICADALVLDNDGVFSECEDVETPECGGIGNHKCDFHRLRVIGSGDKRLQEGTTGAFGIGLISVYQLTDKPELISKGRHWILHEGPNGGRIDICEGCDKCSSPDLPGTRFVFPFVREETSLRRALNTDRVPENVKSLLLEELEQSLPVAMLFLKNLGTIEVKDEGHPWRTFEREIQNDTLIISQGIAATDSVWHLLRGNFQSVAEELRRMHPDRIESKRSAEVVVALSTEELTSGLLCAVLPTEDNPGLPFHINADFFTSNDRKHIVFGNDYQAHWNRAALSAAAQTVAQTTPQLTRMLGAKRFWHLVSTLYSLRNDGSRSGFLAKFWSAMEGALREEAVVLTSSGDWTTTSSGIAVLQQSEEAVNIPVLEGLGVKVVSEDLRPYQTILRSIGVPVLDIEMLCSALRVMGLDKPVGQDDLPDCLKAMSDRAALWTEIVILLGRRGSAAHKGSLREISLAPTLDNFIRPSQDVHSADESTVQLFESLGLGIHFLDKSEMDFGPLAHLCNLFDVESAVHSLEECDSASIHRLWTEGRFSLRKLIEWFENRREQIADDEERCRRLASLPIYPSDDQLHPLNSLMLPGGFNDPFGLTNIVDVHSLGGRREFLVTLGIATLDFRTYVLNHLSKALDGDELDQTARQKAVTLLADHLGKLIGDDEAHKVLSSARLVKCIDGEYRRADDCYFPDDVVQEVLGGDANIVVLPEGRESAVRELLAWLGVEKGPRIRDIVQTVRRMAGAPCSTAAVIRMQKIVTHLGARADEFGVEESRELEPLKSIEWLPARGDMSQWHKSGSLYAPYQSYLFESQEKILNVPSPSPDFLESIGLHIVPPPDLVVKHLRYCVEHNIPVNTEVYRFLNDNADDPAVERLKGTKCLWLEHRYWSTAHVFWDDHPFGQYRRRLAEDLRRYVNLLKKIGVADTPNYKHALDVLHEMSWEFGESNSPLDDDSQAVLMNCWEMLEKALNEDTIPSEWLSRELGGIKSIPNEGMVLYEPNWLFFENRAGLAAKFRSFLTTNLITRQLGTEKAFRSAGVQLLGSAVETILIQKDDSADDLDTEKRLRYRRNEIARVLSSQMTSDKVRNALARLDGLSHKSVTTLVIKHRLSAFGKELESKPEPVQALYDRTQCSLWTARQDGQMPWAPLARELASALCPEEDPGLFAAGLKEVLAAVTAAEAAKTLDELGFSQLDVSIVVRPPISKTVQDLGVETPVDREGLPPQDPKDEARPEVRPDTIEAPGESDTPSKGDTTRFPSPRQPSTPKPTDVSDEGIPRTDGKPSSPEKRSDGGVHRQEGRPGTRREFVTYVVVSHGDERPESDGLTHQERMNLEEEAISLILKREPALERTPTNNPGFDLTEKGPDGQRVRWVEVKAMKGTLDDRSVTLSRTQFECAQKHGDAYWLYVVESAATPEEARILRIRNPAGKAQNFSFDHGWATVAEDMKAAEVTQGTE